MVHLEFGLDAPLDRWDGAMLDKQSATESLCYRYWRRNVHAPNRLRRVGSTPNCPDVELAAPSWPRRIGIAESAAPSCPRPQVKELKDDDDDDDDDDSSVSMSRHMRWSTSLRHMSIWCKKFYLLDGSTGAAPSTNTKTTSLNDSNNSTYTTSQWDRQTDRQR